MTGFSFNPPNVDSDPPVPPPSDQDVVCDGWWPAINMADVRAFATLDTKVTPDRLRDAIVNAMLEIATAPAMAAWKAEQVAFGYDGLFEVPGRIEVNGKSDYEHRWQRAVLSVIGGDLGERLVGQNMTSSGVERAEALRFDIDVHQRNVRFAVRDFLGRPRVRASVI